MATPTIDRPRPATPAKWRLLPTTTVGRWALGCQLLAAAFPAYWPTLGRALGHLANPLTFVVPVVIAASAIGVGSLALFGRKDRSTLLATLFTITTAGFVLGGVFVLAFALFPPDVKPGP